MTILGPFLGWVTPTSVKVWLHLESEIQTVYVTVRHDVTDPQAIASASLELRAELLFTDCATVDGLTPDTKYYYQLWADPEQTAPLDLEGLLPEELNFRTLPEEQKGEGQIDFLIMSCHNPTVSGKDGHDGFAVWADIPQIISTDSNKRVRFALLIGDQVYADAWSDRILGETDEGRCLHLYLEVYRKFWNHIHYRRVLCSLPAMMIWDDHDIIDGWGSEIKSFKGETDQFKPEWERLFRAASKAFSIMQASRNPPLLTDKTFDCCFRIGKWGFVLADLRTNRNFRRNQVVTADQMAAIKAWVDAEKPNLRALFVVSPVVFSHGSPVIEDLLVKWWPWVLKGVERLAGNVTWAKGLQASFSKSLGDIRDDIRDSWGSSENAEQTDQMLDYLFALQNEGAHPVSVVLLCGDIHTSGYATIYSSSDEHLGRSTIPHVTSSSVSYAPFNWLLEAVYRRDAKTAKLGKKGLYSSQISHHICARSVAILSIRPKAGDDYQLKVKYYLEGYPEPQIVSFELDKRSHREDIAWVAHEQLFPARYSPSVTFDVESALRERAKAADKKLNYDTSVVDLMKLLKMDSTLGARKRLAYRWGYTGALNGSAEMNTWLRKQVVQRFAEGGGAVPEDAQK
jgi:hypothetical protein